MFVFRHDDRRLEVTHLFDALESRRVFREIEHFVVDSLAIERTIRRVALHAGRLGINGDRHDVPLQSRFGLEHYI